MLNILELSKRFLQKHSTSIWQVGNKKKDNCIQILNIYFVQSHKPNFLKPSYFYKIICMFSDYSEESAHLRSLISRLHATYTDSSSK